MTGLQYFTEADKQKVTAAIQMQAAQAQQTQQPPPPVPPEVQMMLQAPTWEQIIETLHNNVIFHYKVDIETNSTIDAEASQDKQDISELLNALSQFLNGVAPLVEQGVMPIEVAKGMLLVICRRYNFGSQIEEAIEAMKEPPKQGADPAAEAKAQAEKAKAEAAAAKAKQDMQQGQLDGQLAQQDFENKKNLMMLDQATLEIKRQAWKSSVIWHEDGTSANRQKMEAAKKPKETVSA
jgi:hypothetical protein